MQLNRNSVELLAPAGTEEALKAAISAGADAVYLGGKHFNMRVHKNDFNFDDIALKKAIDFAHDKNVKLYVTINNLISDEELPALRDYLLYLNEIKPDALLVQDFAIIKLIRDLKINIPIHASIMMNIHNQYAVELLNRYGITRVVVSRELSLDQVHLLKFQTGIETEYFIHGDMCISESGQCIHSGVIFGQSGNRGRCLKPCRWRYALIDESNNQVIDDFSYKMALKDMCMYRNIPELINAGIYSFKIEGRMRPPEFIHRIVSTYREAIDRYLADPTGYTLDEAAYRSLFDNRARDFTTVFALNRTTVDDIGTTGEREPRFFSKPVIEPAFDDKTAADIFDGESPINETINKNERPNLSVRVATVEAAKSAIEAGADTVYCGGEAFRPQSVWSLKDYQDIIDFAHSKSAKVIINTPRTTYQRGCSELKYLLSKLSIFENKPDGILVSNLGSLVLTKKFNLPVRTDLSFNLFNHEATQFLKDNGVEMAAASLELSYSQLKSMIVNANLPIEVVVHGAYESMICDHDFINMYNKFDRWSEADALNRHYSFKDEAGQMHRIRIDQFGRSHIYFAKDLCLYNYLKYFVGASSLRIEAQLYSPEQVAFITRAYRHAIDELADGKALPAFPFTDDQANLGIGVYRFRQSMDS
ncbi:MAG: U32 family peptidase [Selenomonadaceae bacterium]|nr:U32 family peptidase [Selenomonadaceae bacterium]